MPISLHVENWRCIKGLDVELANVNVLIGRNSSGKSSLAYAAYLLAKAPHVGSAPQLVQGLYNQGLAGGPEPLNLKQSSSRYS
jgi:predicted ATPase